MAKDKQTEEKIAIPDAGDVARYAPGAAGQAANAPSTSPGGESPAAAETVESLQARLSHPGHRLSQPVQAGGRDRILSNSASLMAISP